MKQFNTKLRKFLFLPFFILILFPLKTKSQFTTAGDIAFTGYIAAETSNIESFSFVILKNIPAGSTLNFTDRGWNGTVFNATTESLLTWTTGSALVAGREITISGLANSTTMTVVVSGSNINAGTATGTMVNLATSGDQILAYVGTVAAPTFIAGIHMNSYNNTAGGFDCGNTTAAAWDNATPGNTCVNPGNLNSSAMPTGLTGGTTAVYIGTDNQFNSDYDNARFACIGPLATPAQIRAAVNNFTHDPASPWNGINWTTQNGVPTIILPSGCAYLASIFPLDIVNFTGSNEVNFIKLNWQTANEANDYNRIELEKSADGIRFNTITSMGSQGFSYLYNNYSYKDMHPLQGANFYRLKIISPNGNTKYSTILKVLFGIYGKAVIITPTTASNDITVSFTGSQFNQLVIADMTGSIVMTERLVTNNQHINVSRLPAGQYTVSFMGTSQKVTEKIVIVK